MSGAKEKKKSSAKFHTRAATKRKVASLPLSWFHSKSFQVEIFMLSPVYPCQCHQRSPALHLKLLPSSDLTGVSEANSEPVSAGLGQRCATACDHLCNAQELGRCSLPLQDTSQPHFQEFPLLPIRHMSTLPLGRWENREQEKYSVNKRYRRLHSIFLLPLIVFPSSSYHTQYLCPTLLKTFLQLNSQPLLTVCSVKGHWMWGLHKLKAVNTNARSCFPQLNSLLLEYQSVGFFWL